MNNILFLIVFTSYCILKSGEKPHQIVWKHLNSSSKDSVETHIVKEGNILMPYVWKYLKNEIFDNLLLQSANYDSLINKYGKGEIQEEPDPLISQINGIFIFYTGKKNVNFGNCDMEISQFSINEGEEFNPNNCYSVSYIKNVGIVACVHKQNKIPSFGWDKYILIDLKDENHNTIIDKQLLAKIIDEILNN